MLDEQEMQRVIGSTAYSRDGDKIGSVGQLFLDDQTGEPEFITVKTGMFGGSETFVPLANASMDGDRVTVPFSKDKVKDAPNVDAESGHLSQEQERQVYDYYEMSYTEATSDSGLPGGAPPTVGRGTETDTDGAGAVGHDVSGPTTDDAMTRSEERVDVGTERRESGRVRLRKYVETEHVQQTVPVRKERAVLEREPITDANRDEAMSGPDISEEEHEVVLSEERPVVEKHTEPVERVRIGKTEEQREAEVSEEVRKERIEGEGDIRDR